jgi:hypothetical protein
LVKDSTKNTTGIISLLDMNLFPKDLVSNFTILSDLAFGLAYNFRYEPCLASDQISHLHLP